MAAKKGRRLLRDGRAGGPGAPARVGILTSGADAPGLNAVIRGAVTRLAAGGARALGVLEGWRGLIERSARELSVAETSGLAAAGGSVLGTGRLNPCRCPERDLPRLAEGYRGLGLDVLVAVGGAETMAAAARLVAEQRLAVIGVPRAAGNDLAGSDVSVGFLSALGSVVRAVDGLAATAESSRSVIVVECLGRRSGWVAGLAGLAAGADWVVLPEEKPDLGGLCRRLLESRRAGRLHNLVVVAEGARFGGDSVRRPAQGSGAGAGELGGVGELLARLIAKETGLEAHHVKLGPLQRSGAPCAAERLLGTLFGVRAAELALLGRSGRMVALRGGRVSDVPLAEAGRDRGLPGEYLELLRLFRAGG